MSMTFDSMFSFYADLILPLIHM